MVFNGKKVFTQGEFDYSKANIGDYVDADVVMDAMDCLPPACMRLNCAQMGEPYSHEQDPNTGKWRATYSTFKCVDGNFCKGVWEYCGHCFLGESAERGDNPCR